MSSDSKNRMLPTRLVRKRYNVIDRWKKKRNFADAGSHQRSSLLARA